MMYSAESPHATMFCVTFSVSAYEHGFQDVAYERLSLGIVAIHTARKPRKSTISSVGVLS
jgi:ubiquinone/menaquinone biosynthesis C-methylase UbiE